MASKQPDSNLSEKDQYKATPKRGVRRALQFGIYGLLSLLAIVSVVIMLAPALGLYWADRWYQAQGEGYQLSVNDWQFAPLKLSLTLHDVQLTHPPAKTQAEQLAITLDPWALWQKKVHVKSVLLAGLDGDVAYQTQQASTEPELELVVAGLTLPLSQAPTSEQALEQVSEQTSEQTSETSLETTPTMPWTIAIDDITLKNDKLRWRVHSTSAPVSAPATAQTEDAENLQRQSVESIESIESAVTIEHFSFKDFQWPAPAKTEKDTLVEPKPISIKLLATIEHLQIKGRDSLILKAPLNIHIEGGIFELATQPIWQGDIRFENLDVEWQEQLALKIQNIGLSQLLANEQRVVLDAIDISDIQFTPAIASDESTTGSNPLTPLESVSIQHYQANKIFYALPVDGDPDTTILNISTQSLTGLNEILLRDNGVDPTYHGKITLYQVMLGNMSLNPLTGAVEPVALDLQLGLDDYNRIALAGELGWSPSAMQNEAQAASTQASYPQGKLLLKTEQLNLVPFNGYLNQAMGYHAERGMLDLTADIGMQNAMLTGEVKILVRNSRFIPSDEKTVARISKQISMPLDTALDLLRDSNGNVRLTVPLSGSLNDPNVGLNDLTSQLSKLALQKSALYFVQQSLQPYTTLISLASYAGDYLFAIRLDALAFDIASAELTAEHQDRLNNIATMMLKKPDIELTVCPFASEQEVTTLKDDWTKLVAQRATNVKAALAAFKDENGASLATRVTLCKPQQGEEAQVVLGVE